MKRCLAVVAFCVFAAPIALAQEAPGVFVSYSVDMNGSAVKGAMMVARIEDGKAIPQGYDLRRVMSFITEDCASGKVGPVKLGKRVVRKNRGFVKQKFKTSCLGGPHPRIGADQEAKVTVTRQEDGRDLAEYSYSDDGNILTSERYR